jgi:hypothetical protein
LLPSSYFGRPGNSLIVSLDGRVSIAMAKAAPCLVPFATLAGPLARLQRGCNQMHPEPNTPTGQLGKTHMKEVMALTGVAKTGF